MILYWLNNILAISTKTFCNDAKWTNLVGKIASK